MLADSTKNVARRLREFIGKEKCGIGPDINQLAKLFADMAPSDLRVHLDELAKIGFIELDTAIAVSMPGVPRELRGIVGVRIFEPLQEYFDEFDG